MKRYVIVGCGARGIGAYAEPLVKNYSHCGKLCGVYDINKKRAELVSKITNEDIKEYDDFDKMLFEVKPDRVIIATRDCNHDYYAIKAMRAGCDVIVEKPLTTTFEKALAIKKAQEETGRRVTVTFNLRFHNFFIRLKEIVSSGAIGDILSIHYDWMLNTSHGADYFRRWHRNRENSGSLLVHKSSHHFDIANWLLEEKPLYVNAFGTRRFYGPTREERSERCLDCPYKKKCEFYLDITKGDLKTIYLDCENEDGYIRDRCVFADDIDIEDSVSLNVAYSGGAIMSYSLTAHSPYEGMNLTLNGTVGRIEASMFQEKVTGYTSESTQYINVFKRNGERVHYDIVLDDSAAHGGADNNLHERLFEEAEFDDKLCQMADIDAGLMSIGIGMAANISMKEKRQVALGEFYTELENL